MKKFILMTLIISSSSVYADIYEDYKKIDQGFNRKFIKNIAESRAHEGQREAEKYKKNYLVVDGNEEFKKALENGDLDNNLTDSNRIEKEYIYKDFKNLDIKDKDLEGLAGDSLTLGSTINRGNIVQSLNIENSTIKTDRELNAGIVTSSDDVSDITSITQIKDSTLSGGGSNQKKRINTSQDFDN